VRKTASQLKYFPPLGNKLYFILHSLIAVVHTGGRAYAISK